MQNEDPVSMGLSVTVLLCNSYTSIQTHACGQDRISTIAPSSGESGPHTKCHLLLDAGLFPSQQL